MDDAFLDARNRHSVMGAALVIAEKLSEAGVEVMEVDNEMVVLRGDLYPPHISRNLDAVEVSNEERTGVITFTVLSKQFQLLTNPCGGMTFLQVLSFE